MNEKDIHINGWYHHSKEWSARNEDGKECNFQWTAQDWYSVGESTLFLKDISPIPLTKEWLLKFGYEHNPDKTRGDFEFYGHQNGMEVRLSDDERPYVAMYSGWHEEHVALRKVDYVHELQSIVHSLKPEEPKSIEPPPKDDWYNNQVRELN